MFVASPEDLDEVWDNIVLLNSKQADTSTIKACHYVNILKRKKKMFKKTVNVNITKELIEQLMHWPLSGFNKLQECIIIVIYLLIKQAI